MKSIFSKWRRGGHSYANQHKMCPHCGRFIDQGDVTCSYCGGQVGHIRVVKQRGSERSDGQVETTWLLIGICLFFYVLEGINTGQAMSIGWPGLANGNIFSAYWAPDGRIMYLMGSNYAPQLWGGDVWRLIQYMFLHGGIIHIGFNLYALTALGPFVNQAFGIRRFWLTILVTGALGGLISAAGFPYLTKGPSVGVSGALFGLIGVMYAYFRSTGNLFLADRFKKIMINANIFCIIVSFIMPIDNLAHLGGMFTGIGLGFLMFRFSSAKWFIALENLVLLLLTGTWIWGCFEIYHNLTHLKEVAGL